MPYIEPAYKQRINEALEPLLAEMDALNVGALNYVLTRIVNAWLDEWKKVERGVDRYEHLQAGWGALHACATELYRRRIAPFEDRKAAENGDVYSS